MSRTNEICPNCFSYINKRTTVCPKCNFNIAGQDVNSNALPQGTMLNSQRYIIGRVLGSGGFGITYIAFDTGTHERVAIKEYFPCEIAIRANDKSIQPTRDSDIYVDGVNKFYGEAQVLYQLVNCRAVVDVKNFFCDNNTAYIVMEFIEGTSLKEFANSCGGTVDYEFALRITIDIALSMSQVHRLGILHRDISPDNIMISPDCSARLIDFGASREYVNQNREGLSVILKKAYAPPEQYSRKQRQGPYSDIYALAGTFYRVVTGRSVPGALDRMRGSVHMNSMSEICPFVPQHISDTIDRALSTDSMLRHQTMDDFVFDLQNGRSSLTRVIEAEYNLSYDGCLQDKGLRSVEDGPWMNVFYGSYCADRYRLSDNTEVTVGRSKNMSSIAVKNDPLISRVHVRLTPNSARRTTLVEDISANGTFVINRGNSSRLRTGAPTVVEGDALLQLATTDVLIQITF